MTSPPRILDPRTVPVSGTDAHLPPLPREQLTAASLRQRLHAGTHTWLPEMPGDGGSFPGREPASAAVLVPLVERGDSLSVLLTRRTDHLRDHAGQISFPGGRTEPGDPGPAGTALREAQEEVGLAPSRVEVLGELPVYTTVTRFVVTPVVALIQPPFELAQLVLDPHEVAQAYEVPLPFLMDPAHHQRHDVVWGGGRRQFLSMPWRSAAGDEVFIWGATASMLRNLYAFLAQSPR